jgi:hypothetical protein
MKPHQGDLLFVMISDPDRLLYEEFGVRIALSIREPPLRTIKSGVFGTIAHFTNLRESSSLRRPGLRNGIDYYDHA